jgi:hypothetical protein
MIMLKLNDLQVSQELDRAALQAVIGGEGEFGGLGAVNDSFLLGSSVNTNFFNVAVNNTTNVSQYADIDISVLDLFGSASTVGVGLVQSL